MVLSFKFRTGASPDPRRYNAPRVAEVAAIYEGDEPPTNRVITVFPRTSGGASQLHRPSDLSDHLDPLTYPILFPDGQPAWHPGLLYDVSAPSYKAGQRQKISMAEFYSHRLMTRDGPSAQAPLHYDTRRRITIPFSGLPNVDSAPAPARQCKATMLAIHFPSGLLPPRRIDKAAFEQDSQKEAWRRAFFTMFPECQ